MELITIGVIANTHGLRGTLKVKSFTDFKNERYKKGNTLYIAFKSELIPVTVEKFQSVKTVEHIDFKEFTNINQVEKYKGSELQMSSENIHELEEDEFYFEELIGMEVYTDTLIGIVKGVREVPQGELLEVDTNSKKIALIPFNKHFVKSVDKKTNKVVLLEWEGLI